MAWFCCGCHEVRNLSPQIAKATVQIAEFTKEPAAKLARG